MPPELPPTEAVELAAAAALAEDRAFEDVTTLATVPSALQGRARFLAREAGVAAGFPVAAACFRQVDAATRLDQLVPEGSRFAPGEAVAIVDGPARGLLQAERVALNFVQRLCGIATLARAFTDAVAGTRTSILDTRKTTPGLRDLEKYAVRCGGAMNHRRDLAAMAMIKDNHREALARAGGTLDGAVAAIRACAPGVPIEVEIDSLAELEAALAGSPDWVLLDNMDPATVARAVALTAGRAKLEASGGVTLATIAALAATGVDAISVGALTHSARAIDISLELSFLD